MKEKQLEITKEKGIGLLYVIILIAILIIAVGLLGPYLFVRETYRQKDVETLERIKAIRTAILGNPDIISKGLRSNFGYVGDMGGLPPVLEYLVLQQSPTPNPFPVNWNQTLWTIDATTGIGYGWRGPYIDPTYTGNYEFQAFRDAWGTKFRYLDNAGNTIINPATVIFPVFIRSAGPDRTFGTSDDINENTHPELCQINENDVRAILRGYTYCENGNPIQRDNIYVYWPTLNLSGTVSITTGGPYSSSTTGSCPYQPSQTCYYFETPRIPSGIRKATIDTYVNQFVVINGGGTLHDGSANRMRWNFRGGSCGGCITYVNGSRNHYQSALGYDWNVWDIVAIQIRNNCNSPVTINTVRIDYDYFIPAYYETVNFSYPDLSSWGYGWRFDCPGGANPGGQSGVTYSFNFSARFRRVIRWYDWWPRSCQTNPSFTIPANSIGYISFGRFKNFEEDPVDIMGTRFTIYLSDGSVLTVPP